MPWVIGRSRRKSGQLWISDCRRGSPAKLPWKIGARSSVRQHHPTIQTRCLSAMGDNAPPTHLRTS
eukprot:3822750-Pyramimonas_sp.AAC.2